MALYADQFETRLNSAAPEPTLASRTLLIASTPRSGSHFLGHALQATGLFGAPFEYANPANLQEWKSRLGQTEAAGTMASLMEQRVSPNGVFSIKMHWAHIRQLGGLATLWSQFPDVRVFHIQRQDILAQAISYAMAQQTGVWISGQEGNGREPVYDFMRIYKCMMLLIEHNANWRKAIAISGLPCDGMMFEDIRNDLPGAVSRVARLMGVDLSAQSEAVAEQTRRQSGGLNREWRERFAVDLAADRDARPRKMFDLERSARQAASHAARFVRRR